MSEANRELLAAAAAEVLETMFFTTVGGEPEAGQAPVEWISAALEFHGEPGGRFRVGASRPAARALAASFLGLDESEVSGGQVGEVICELANMICGSVVSRLESGAPIQLLHPELVEGPPPETAGILPLEEGLLAVWLELEPAA